MTGIRYSSLFALIFLLVASHKAQPEEQQNNTKRWPTLERQVPTRITQLIGGCRLLARDLQGGAFDAPTEAERSNSAGISFDARGNGKVTVPLICVSATNKTNSNVSLDDGVVFRLGAKQVSGKWVPADGRDNVCDPKRFSKKRVSEIDPNSACFYPEENFKIVNFESRNWQGVGVLLDQITGEPSLRQRIFRYCLIQNQGSGLLCGETYVRYLTRPKDDVLNKVMKVLTSIEFISGLNNSRLPEAANIPPK